MTYDEGVYHITRAIQLIRHEEFKDMGSFHMAKVALGCLGKYFKEVEQKASLSRVPPLEQTRQLCLATVIMGCIFNACDNVQVLKEQLDMLAYLRGMLLNLLMKV